MKHSKTKFAIRLAVCIMLLGIVGCEQPVVQPTTPVRVPESFSNTGSVALEANWWKGFNDATLNSLIEKALTGNFDLQTSWDRLAQAQAVAKKAGAALLPTASLQAGATRTRQETNNTTNYTSLYSVGVAASYEVDLWSRLESTKKAAMLDVQATRDALETAAITLASSVANTWYQLAEAKALVQIAKDQIKTNRDVNDIVTVQFRNGKASAADVLRQRQLIASTEASLISAEENVALLQYTLCVLTGIRPELAWRENAIELPDLPPMPDTGVPSEVLLRRPDVLGAYRRVQAADQRMAVAIADQYPRISLSSKLETSAVTMHDLFDNWLANLAANITQPLFDAGLRKAEVERQKAIVRENVNSWSQTILEALQDVETALTQEQQQVLLLENLKQQFSLAGEAYRRNDESYRNGQIDYIRVLESQQSLQSLERSVVTSRRTLVQRRIDLYRAIAGPCELQEPFITEMYELLQPAVDSESMIDSNQVSQ